jgi:hypothetical protein
LLPFAEVNLLINPSRRLIDFINFNNISSINNAPASASLASSFTPLPTLNVLAQVRCYGSLKVRLIAPAPSS